MKYKIAFLIFFLLGSGINYHFDTRHITYDYSVTAALLGAMANLIGALSLLVIIFIVWGVGIFVRDKKLPNGFLDKFLLYGCWIISIIIVNRLVLELWIR